MIIHYSVKILDREVAYDTIDVVKEIQENESWWDVIGRRLTELYREYGTWCEISLRIPPEE